MADAKKADKSIFVALLDWYNGPPPAPRKLKPLPKIPSKGEIIYNKTMTQEFKDKEPWADAKAREKWGYPAMHWLVTRYEDGSVYKTERSYSAFYDFVIQAAKKNQISPEFLHVVAMGEGLMKFCDAQQLAGAVATIRENNTIDTYQKAGLDNLGHDMEGLRGYLSDDQFKYIKPYPGVIGNELKQPVLPAFVYGLDAAINIISAYLQKCRKAAVIFLKSINEDSASQNEDIVNFVTYALFNNPLVSTGDIKKMGIKAYTRKHESQASDAELRKAIKADQTLVRPNSLVRMAAYERMKLLEVYA